MFAVTVGSLPSPRTNSVWRSSERGCSAVQGGAFQETPCTRSPAKKASPPSVRNYLVFGLRETGRRGPVSCVRRCPQGFRKSGVILKEDVCLLICLSSKNDLRGTISLGGTFQLAWEPRHAGLGAGPVFPEGPFYLLAPHSGVRVSRQDSVSLPGALPRD